MTVKEEQILEFAERAARDGFRSVALRTEVLTPDLASRVLQRLPEGEGFAPEKIATHLDRLPGGSDASVRVGRSASQASLSLAIPGSPAKAFQWIEGLMGATGATSVKMNFGPGKPTDAKIFWGTPEVNTLIEIGGEERD